MCTCFVQLKNVLLISCAFTSGASLNEKASAFVSLPFQSDVPPAASLLNIQTQRNVWFNLWFWVRNGNLIYRALGCITAQDLRFLWNRIIAKMKTVNLVTFMDTFHSDSTARPSVVGNAGNFGRSHSLHDDTDRLLTRAYIKSLKVLNFVSQINKT